MLIKAVVAILVVESPEVGVVDNGIPVKVGEASGANVEVSIPATEAMVA